jgi:hypothetical protein
MKKISTILFLSIAAISLNAQMNSVVVSFEHNVGAYPMILNESIFPIWNGKNVIIKRAQFYLSQTEIQHPDNSIMPLSDQYMLVDASDPDAEFDLGSWEVDAAHGLTLHIGVDAEHNHLDPASYPSGHPLGFQSPDMHWGWAAGYRFLVIEGLVDNNGDGVPESIFQYHSLDDALYKSVQLSTETEAANDVLHLHMVLDYSKLFENIALSGNLIHHGSDPSNVLMMNNAANNGFITFPGITASEDLNDNNLTVTASPNPANQSAVITYDLPGNRLDLKVTNLLGQEIRTYSGLPGSGTFTIDVTDLPKGIYQYTFSENGKLLAGKQIIVCE